MALPFFYIDSYEETQMQLVLNEETSKHVVQVLRMKKGEQLNLTDGLGNLLTCEITDDHKKQCAVQVRSRIQNPKPRRSVSIAISLLKNSNRFEWFLEKATEIGVQEIIPLLCERTEKEKFRHDRLKGICISAMLQSQQTWLPVLQEPVPFENVVSQSGHEKRFIAHCDEADKKTLAHYPLTGSVGCQVLIGPEGDFTSREIELALSHQFIPVSLGETRLRTETAGVVAAALLCLNLP